MTSTQTHGKQHMRRLASTMMIASVAGYLAFAAGAQAATLTGSINLSDGADSLQIGDATVSGIVCNGTGCGGEMLAVTSSPGGYAGIKIVGAGGGTLLNNTSGRTEDLTLNFEVQSAPGNITGIGLAVGGGTGTVTVGETVVDYNSGSSLANSSGNGHNSSTTLTLSQADNNIYITKDIAVSPASSLLSVTQYFYDVPGSNAVPEPGMFAVFVLAGAGFAVLRRWRRRTA